MTTNLPAAATATFGASIDAEGNIETICDGQFDAGHADAIAQKLVLLAASIRSTARQRLAESDE